MPRKSDYITWSKKSKEAEEIVKLLDLYKASEGLQGLNPDADSRAVRDFYETTRSLQKYNPQYFYTNFKNLVAAYNLNYDLNRGRRKFLFYIHLYLL